AAQPVGHSAPVAAEALFQKPPPATEKLPRPSELPATEDGAEALEVLAHSHVPPGERPASLGVDHLSRAAFFAEAVEHIQPGRADDDEGPAAEGLRVEERIGPPQVVLTVPVALRQPDRVHGRMPGTVEAQLARQEPGRRDEDWLLALLLAQLLADAVHLRRERSPALQPAGRVEATQRIRPLGRDRP